MTLPLKFCRAHTLLSSAQDNKVNINIQGLQHELRVRPDRSADARQRAYILGQLWQGLAGLTAARPQISIGSSGPKGKVFVIDRESDLIHNVFNVSGHGPELHISIDVACESLGFDETVLMTIVDNAKRAADARGTRVSR